MQFLASANRLYAIDNKEVLTYQIKAPVQWGVTTTAATRENGGVSIKALVQWGVTTTL